jgi:hypothetical protein
MVIKLLNVKIPASKTLLRNCMVIRLLNVKIPAAKTLLLLV